MALFSSLKFYTVAWYSVYEHPIGEPTLCRQGETSVQHAAVLFAKSTATALAHPTQCQTQRSFLLRLSSCQHPRRGVAECKKNCKQICLAWWAVLLEWVGSAVCARPPAGAVRQGRIGAKRTGSVGRQGKREMCNRHSSTARHLQCGERYIRRRRATRQMGIICR